jgi:hypothetical protein
LYPPLRFASLYVAVGTARKTGVHRPPEPLFNPKDHDRATCRAALHLLRDS